MDIPVLIFIDLLAFVYTLIFVIIIHILIIITSRSALSKICISKDRFGPQTIRVQHSESSLALYTFWKDKTEYYTLRESNPCNPCFFSTRALARIKEMIDIPTNLTEGVLDLVLVGRLKAVTHHPSDGLQCLYLIYHCVTIWWQEQLTMTLTMTKTMTMTMANLLFDDELVDESEIF